MAKKLVLLSLSVLVLMLITGYGAYAQELESIDIGDAAGNPGSTEVAGGVYTINGSGNGNMATAVYDSFIITQNGRQVFPSMAVEPEGKLSVMWGKVRSE